MNSALCLQRLCQGCDGGLAVVSQRRKPVGDAQRSPGRGCGAESEWGRSRAAGGCFRFTPRPSPGPAREASPSQVPLRTHLLGRGRPPRLLRLLCSHRSRRLCRGILRPQPDRPAAGLCPTLYVPQLGYTARLRGSAAVPRLCWSTPGRGAVLRLTIQCCGDLVEKGT